MANTAIEIAYSGIRKSIFDGDFPPGFHLREEELAETFEVSRTPVREAMRRLVEEGLVEIRENRRSYVSDVSPQELEDIFDVLSMLESYSVSLAAKRITDEQLEELKGLQDQLESCGEEDESFIRLNSQFHKALHRISGSKRLYDIIVQLVNFPSTCYLKVGVHTENDTANQQHRNIIDALERRDADWAALQMKMHTETVRQEYRQLLNAKTGE
ncbi:GntR family transcriptional regulator [Pseudomaricurvus alkylphenolicus]|jgi:DNA-binding GntR family transcriptional regulator|uniref:GntR family transcriptional regulator n=1 Tax=Pseudomaricurvus alkylphenolicus TaxID=1306991 RepID=UPI0014200BAA|nr:GntR family transcriptional regulator [Pseudomaricurvus alkylphenolicus]NIB38907.1 GntR family transcriptional regulator [Pseudomaricurvus alkylphenolicus]